MKFPFQSCFHNLRQIRSINLMCFVVTDCRQGLVGIINDRRTFIRSYRRDTLNHVINLICIRYNYFLCKITAQILELRKHLIRRPEIKRRLSVCIMETFSCHHDPSIYLILRIKEMHITGCNNRLAKLLAKITDLPVHILQIFHGLNGCFLIVKQEHIISDRLNLIIIIEITKSCNLILALAIQNCTVEFTRLTGRSYD